MSVTLLTPSVFVGESAIFTMAIKKEDGSVLPVSQLTYAKLTYYDKETHTVINSRSGQDILNVNDVTIDSVGLLIWSIQPADAILVDSRKELEEHEALFEWGWSVSKVGKHEIAFNVESVALSSL